MFLYVVGQQTAGSNKGEQKHGAYLLLLPTGKNGGNGVEW